MRDDTYPTPISDPEAEGLPLYADDDSNAYGDDLHQPRMADGPDPAPLPGDQPLAVDRFGTTAEEARRGESLDYKLARENRDSNGGAAAAGAPARDEPAGDEGDALTENLDRMPARALDAPDAPVDPYDKVSMYDRDDVGDPQRRVGRLVEPDEGVRADVEPDAVAYDAGAAGGGETAEEAAVHEVRDA
jgi:hypothetical protein